MLKYLILFYMFFGLGCNIQMPSNIDSTQYYSCHASTHDFTACCLGRGGAQTCKSPVDGFYFRNSDNALVCGDGSVSTGCFK